MDGDEPTELKFAHGPQTTLSFADYSDRIAATIRYEDERGIEDHDEIEVVDADTGEKKGEATVVHAREMQLRGALRAAKNMGAVYGHDSIDSLVTAMNGFYEDTIDAGTEVKLILLDPEMGEE